MRSKCKSTITQFTGAVVAPALHTAANDGAGVKFTGRYRRHRAGNAVDAARGSGSAKTGDGTVADLAEGVVAPAFDDTADNRTAVDIASRDSRDAGVGGGSQCGRETLGKCTVGELAPKALPPALQAAVD